MRPRIHLVLVSVAALVAMRAQTAVEAYPGRTILVPQDAATIQGAIDLAKAGDTILVSEGTYTESVRIAGRDSLTLRGDGNARIDGVGTEPAVTVEGGKNMIVQDLLLSSPTDAVLLLSTRNPSVRGIFVTSAAGDGVHALDSRDITVKDSRFVGVTHTAVNLESVSEGTSIVTGNTILSPGRGGVFIHNAYDAAHDVRVNDNTIQSPGGRAVRIECGWDVWVERNTVTRAGTDGLSVHRAGRTLTLTSNTIAGARLAGVRVDTSSNVRIEDNDVSDTGGQAVDVSAIRAQIDRNTIETAGGTGIRLTGITTQEIGFTDDQQWEQSVTGNSISGAEDGVVVQARPVQSFTNGRLEVVAIGENTVSDSGANGIVVSGAGLAIVGNIVERPGIDGIVVANLNGGLHISIDSNTVVAPGSDGIDLGGADKVDVYRNRVTEAGDCGFRLGDGATKNRIEGNVAESCSQWGLWESRLAKQNKISKLNTLGEIRRGRHKARRR